MSGENIFIVNEDEYIRESVKFSLLSDSYRVFCLSSGDETLRLARLEKPRLIILDLMLPGLSGMDVLKALKRDPQTRDIQVLILSAKADSAEIVSGLELGAEDYLTKPFHPKVLLSRIRSLVRNGHQPARDHRTPAIQINREKHEIQVRGENLQVTRAEFKLLELLASRQGKVFTRDQIIHFIHGPEYTVSKRSVDVLVAEVRKKHKALYYMVRTIRGVGYKLLEPGPETGLPN